MMCVFNSLAEKADSAQDSAMEATVAYRSAGEETGGEETGGKEEEGEGGMECEPTVAYNLGQSEVGYW